eukprot:gnl/Dysnectes_brevis/1048_a1168_4597.p1 GENE.gnl/Dysnectes_brevis/1048_a1168_4597~~gnl/Dysnectes_brevis/1048_a1168_4597.p1  ORF type:complete len:137 (-),score=2.48 gnl/Dysnectes_brevis/1048_a1168_4597:75-455(-)
MLSHRKRLLKNLIDTSFSTAKSASDFCRVSQSFMDQLCTSIENVDPDCDVDISDGVLQYESDNGVYILNRNIPFQQLWLSSPISGPSHWALGTEWTNTADSSISLSPLLESELKQVLGDEFILETE